MRRWRPDRSTAGGGVVGRERRVGTFSAPGARSGRIGVPCSRRARRARPEHRLPQVHRHLDRCSVGAGVTEPAVRPPRWPPTRRSGEVRGDWVSDVEVACRGSSRSTPARAGSQRPRRRFAGCPCRRNRGRVGRGRDRRWTCPGAGLRGIFTMLRVAVPRDDRVVDHHEALAGDVRLRVERHASRRGPLHLGGGDEGAADEAVLDQAPADSRTGMPLAALAALGRRQRCRTRARPSA